MFNTTMYASEKEAIHLDYNPERAVVMIKCAHLFTKKERQRYVALLRITAALTERLADAPQHAFPYVHDGDIRIEFVDALDERDLAAVKTAILAAVKAS